MRQPWRCNLFCRPDVRQRGVAMLVIPELDYTVALAGNRRAQRYSAAMLTLHHTPQVSSRVPRPSSANSKKLLSCRSV